MLNNNRNSNDIQIRSISTQTNEILDCSQRSWLINILLNNIREYIQHYNAMLLYQLILI